MSEMVERVANAIYQTRVVGGSDDEAARAAIEAMRSPTVAMMKEGGKQVAHDGWFVEPQIAGNAWSRMIDAALSED